MCGIAIVLAPDPAVAPAEQDIRRMLGMIRHRGPDEFGIYLDDHAALGSARLSIIDLSSGQQPISNEDGTLWIVFNGEIFNYVELRPELEARGHKFTTDSDTEVLLHMFEEYGADCLRRLNGQFAFAIWNTRNKTLFLARDRLGVRPLFYTFKDRRLVAGSEIKVILAEGITSARLDPAGLGQVFTFWSALSPRTAFEGIFEVPPGHYMLARPGEFKISPYWQLEFPSFDGNGSRTQKPLEEYLEEFQALLVDAAKIRLRADVPVGAYLSGGLDSSTIASIIRNYTSNRLDTFSIAFNDSNFDESAFQRQMARFLGTQHQVVDATHADIGRVFPDVIWHAEIPVMRTAPAPMFMLSKLVRDSGYKVVLTGEGADEFLAGYDIFKEAAVRRFWASQPGSARRPLLFQRLYPDISELSRNNPAMLAAFFRENLTTTDAADYSHAIRWRNGRRNCRFLSDEIRSEMSIRRADSIDGQLHPDFGSWHPLARAQFLEIKVFLSQYLLSSQGDRVAMAHSVEGRYPFLDYRVVDYCNRLPANLKLRVLTEKYLLKQLGKKCLPAQIWQRPKRPYRAPIHRSFFNHATQDYVLELLSPEKLKANGYFKPQPVAQLVQRLREGFQVGETDDMAIAGVLSTQLLHQHFIENFATRAPVSDKDRIKLCNRQPQPSSSSIAGERCQG